MPQLSNLASGGVTKVSHGSETVTFTYDEDKLSGTLEKRLNTLKERVDSLETEQPAVIQEVKRDLAAILCELATSWDVTEDAEGTIMVPFDLPHVAQASIRFIMSSINAIADAITAKNPAGMTSHASAKRSANTARRRGSSRTSSSR